MKKEMHYLLTEKQLNRYIIIQNLIEGNLKPCEAARALDLSERQVLSLKKGVIEEGPAFITHKNRGRNPSPLFYL